MADRPEAKRYTDEEAREILRRAAERQQLEDDRTPHEDLLAAAREVGIDPDHFDAAALEVARERQSAAHAVGSHGALRDRVAALRHEQRQGFLYRLALYVVVIGALGTIDYLTGGGWWVQWVALGWGALLAIRGVRLLRPPSDLVRELEKRERRERKKTELEARGSERSRRRDERRRRREESRREAQDEAAAKRDRKAARKKAEKEFEAAVEQGVDVLLAHIARRVKDAARQAGGADAASPAAGAGAAQGRVRVETDEPEEPPAPAEAEAEIDDEHRQER